jgi:RNA polymerase sigma-70 factor, ECF subfamily
MSAIALSAVPFDFAGCEQVGESPRIMEVASGEPPTMDEDAFRALYVRTARPLRAYLARVTGNHALADDLLQETYYRFLRSSFRTDDESYRKNYLYRIATNLMRDHFRRPKIEVQDPADRAVEPAFSHEVHLRADVGGAIARLGPRDRAMLWLAYVEGWSHEEIAAVLELKPKSVRSMLSRARARMAELLRARGLGTTVLGTGGAS